MNQSTKLMMTSKWLRVVEEYELIKQKRSTSFATVDALCQAFQVNRKDIRTYYHRWLSAGKDRDALLPHKRGPKFGTRKMLSKEDERMIVKIRRRLHANEHEILHMIHGHFQVPPSVTTIYRTWKRYPLNKVRKAKIKRYVKDYPGELFHADTHRLPKTLFVDRQQRFLLGVIDDHTRLCYVGLLSRLTATETLLSFTQGMKWFYQHGITAEKLMTDNGSEFTSWNCPKPEEKHVFEVLLRIFGIKHIYTKPYCPQTNGKIERFWRVFKEQFVQQQTQNLTEKDFLQELEQFMYYYNYERLHGGLTFITPFQALKNVTELLK